MQLTGRGGPGFPEARDAPRRQQAKALTSCGRQAERLQLICHPSGASAQVKENGVLTNTRRTVGGFGRLSPLVSVALACAAGSTSTAPPGSAPVPPPLRPIVAAVRKFVVDTMRVLGAPGAAICVRKDGRLVWSEGFGYADLEQHVPVTPKPSSASGACPSHSLLLHWAC